MITLEELNPHNYEPTPTQDANLHQLLEAMNLVRTAFGKPMIVTSGLRSPQDQARINPTKPRSAHTLGAACDISDPDRSLWGWCIDNLKLLEKWGLYLEDKSFTPRWVHFQCIPPQSGHRIFIP